MLFSNGLFEFKYFYTFCKFLKIFIRPQIFLIVINKFIQSHNFYAVRQFFI